MPYGLKQPVGQKRLTNIAVVRYRKQGKCFEIACYKNKVLNWRSGIETDLDEVLQTTAIFKNVGKGILAKEADLKAVFGNMDEQAVCLEILLNGELQVSEKERRLEYETLFKDVAAVIAQQCVDPSSKRPYTITMIERALRDVHFNVDPKKTAKQQAIGEALPLLQQSLSIDRAKMRLKLQVPIGCAADLLAQLQQLEVLVEAKDANEDSMTVVCLINPGSYRQLNALIQDVAKGAGRMELLNLAAEKERAVQLSVPAQLPMNPISSQVSRNDTPLAPKSIPQKKERPKPGTGAIVFPRGHIYEMPDDFARKELFLEIDKYQKGWKVELVSRDGSDVVDAVFFSPNGDMVGAFSKARRMALAASK